MRFEELLKNKEADGEAAGKAQGEKRLLDLIAAMTKDNLVEQIPKLANDPEFFREMCEKYRLLE